MKPPLCTTLIVVALLASPLPPPNTLAAQGPHLSRRLPAVEVAILKALRESGLEEGVERIAADTNGQLVVASFDFTTPSTSPQSLFSVERDAWARAEAIFVSPLVAPSRGAGTWAKRSVSTAADVPRAAHHLLGACAGVG